MMANRYRFVTRITTVKRAVLCGMTFVAVGLALAGVLTNSDRARTSHAPAIEIAQPEFIDVDTARIEQVAAPPPPALERPDED